jgi:UDP-GlcNAc:undecaprenyl-phosphate GlcNAc-1-phosphate transferase
MDNLLWLAGKAFLIALILTPIVRDTFRSYNMVDRPGHRKVHAYPIPRVGGIAIAIAYAACLIPGIGAQPEFTGPLWKLLPGAAMVFLTGLVDDFFPLKTLLKIAGLVTAASLVFWNGLHIGDLAAQPLPMWLDYPLTVFWLLLTSNALNLIDGLDGLCAGMGLMATLTLFAAAWLHHNHPLENATLPLAGALLGFLCYNINPATVFLGDSGALLIGFML